MKLVRSACLKQKEDMSERTNDTLPIEIQETQAFESWRRERSGRERIPGRLLTEMSDYADAGTKAAAAMAGGRMGILLPGLAAWLTRPSNWSKMWSCKHQLLTSRNGYVNLSILWKQAR